MYVLTSDRLNGSFIIKLEIPRPFGNRVRNNLDASPTAVDFRLLCPYFYVFGKKLVNLIEDQRLPGILEKVKHTTLYSTIIAMAD